MTQPAKVFRALSDPNRLRIVNILSQGSICVCDLQEVLGLSQPFISRHLAYLRKVGLVRDRRDGPRVCYSLKLDTTLGRAVRPFLEEVLPLSDDFQSDIRRLHECEKTGKLRSRGVESLPSQPAVCVLPVAAGNPAEAVRLEEATPARAHAQSANAEQASSRRRVVKVKILLCNCKGLCPSFKDADMNTLPFQVESELDVQYTIVHPQLCGQGGNEVVADVMRESAAEAESYVVGGACAPEAQFKLFKKVMRKTGFEESRFVPLDIRGTTNEGILARLKEAVDSIVKPQADAGPTRAAA
jgi:ArsR family transcriptional regulator